jgi:hypothetical protein
MAKNQVDNSQEEHIINKNKPAKEAERTEVIYTITGQQDYLENDRYPCVQMDAEVAKESPNAFAMQVSIGKRTKYYAKRGRHGRLYNPLGMFSEGMAAKRLGHAGRLEWRFIEIGKRAFEFYRDFLRTKNIAYLHNAERELL